MMISHLATACGLLHPNLRHCSSAAPALLQLFVPRQRRSMFGRRAVSVAGPAAWNSLPDYLRDPTRSFDSFRSDLKTFFSRYTSVHGALDASRLCCINLLLTLTLTLSIDELNSD